MNVLIYTNNREGGEERSHSHDIMKDFATGAKVCNVAMERVEAGQFDGYRSGFDMVAYCGMDGYARQILDTYVKRKVRVLLIDKGLIRNQNKSSYNRVCIDCATPNLYLMRKNRPDDRWQSLYQPIWPKRQPTAGYGRILYANNSQCVHDFWGLGNAQTYAENVFRQLRSINANTQLEYRPKRSLEYHSIHRVRMSLPPDTIEHALRRCKLLVTYGSSCAVNAIMRGIPVVALGKCVSDPVCPNKTLMKGILSPVFPSDSKRYQWLSNLAYAQWSHGEFASGEMMSFILGEIRALNAARDSKAKS